MASGDVAPQEVLHPRRVQGNSQAAYQKFSEKMDAYKNTSQLKPAETHRLFVFSADLWTECSPAPWANPRVWN